MDPRDQVRLLLSDTGDDPLFDNDQIDAFLAMEDGRVKRAAAQALDTIADSQVLTLKVLRTQDRQTDGAKMADSLRKRAATLRAQDDAADDSGQTAFVVVPYRDTRYPQRIELTEPTWPYGPVY